MSAARDYIAWSLLTAGLLAAVGGVVGIALRKFGVLDGWLASSGDRLQRRLDRRLARGEDKYFEELRSIETAIAQHRAGTIPSGPPKFKAANDALIVVWTLILGFILVQWFGQSLVGIKAPAWSNGLVFCWLPVAGVQRILDSMQPGAQNAITTRFVGLCFLMLGTVMVLVDVMHPLRGTGA